jgi:hypothetical protein
METVSEHSIKMTSYTQCLDQMGCKILYELTGTMLQSPLLAIKASQLIISNWEEGVYPFSFGKDESY